MKYTFLLGLMTLGTAFGAAQAEERVTFYEDVLPILQENCQICHRPGGANLGGMVAPMSLVTYEETRPWAKSMAKKVSERQMPPWHASTDQHGVFANERTMTESEIDVIVRWAQTGARKGNPNDAPEMLEWPSNDGWSIGTPDLVVKMPEPYFVEDDVEDLYTYFQSTVTKDMLPEDRFIKAVEFRPGSSAVHHIIALPLGGIAPGNDPTVWPDGIGVPLEPGTEITWQMHYHKEPGPGTGVWDQSMVAIKLYPEDAHIEHQLKGNNLGRFDLRVPPGEANYTIQQDYTFKHDAQIVQLMPHMHLRGKAAKYEAYYPDGRSEVLLDVPQYDFNWQTSYKFKEFKEVPAGTKVVFTTVFDNSVDNIYNPDPTQEVRFGQPTTDEMSFGYMSFIDDSGEAEPMFGGFRRARGEGGGPSLVAVIDMFDANDDGLLQEDEAPEQMQRFFSVMDRNGDGAIDKEEAEAAERFRRSRGERR